MARVRIVEGFDGGDMVDTNPRNLASRGDTSTADGDVSLQ